MTALTAREYHVASGGSGNDFTSCLRHLLREHGYRGRTFVYEEPGLDEVVITNAPVRLVREACSLTDSRIRTRMTAMCAASMDCDVRPDHIGAGGQPVCTTHD